jgi:hypothetical protein
MNESVLPALIRKHVEAKGVCILFSWLRLGAFGAICCSFSWLTDEQSTKKTISIRI